MASTTGGDDGDRQGRGLPRYDQQRYDQQGYDQQGYDQQSYGTPHGGSPATPRNGVGTVALVLGILSILLFWVAGLGLVPGVIGLVLGIVGLRRVRRGRATNRGVARAGLITSVVGVVLSLVTAVLLAVTLGTAWNNGGRELVSCFQDSGDDQAAAQACFDTFSQRSGGTVDS